MPRFNFFEAVYCFLLQKVDVSCFVKPCKVFVFFKPCNLFSLAKSCILLFCKTMQRFIFKTEKCFYSFPKRSQETFANLLRNAAKSWRVSIMLLHWLPTDFFLLFWCKGKLFTLKKPGFHAPLVLKTLLHGTKVPKLASRAWARANSQVGAPSPDLARANWEVGARQVRTWRAN